MPWIIYIFVFLLDFLSKHKSYHLRLFVYHSLLERLFLFSQFVLSFLKLKFTKMSGRSWKIRKLCSIFVMAMRMSCVASDKIRMHKRKNRDVAARRTRYIMEQSKEFHRLDFQKRDRTRMNARIVNGEYAPHGRFPYFCYLHMIMKDINEDGIEAEYVYTCGASLIAPNTVLTAAHCITEAYSSYYERDAGEEYNWYNIAAEDIVVAIGIHDVSDTENAEDVFVMDVVSVEIHPQFDLYSGSTFEYDIALFQLNGNIPEEKIRPIEMDNGNGRIKLSPGDDLLAIGFGRTSSDSALSYALQQTTVDYISNDECQSMWSEHITDNIMCTYRDNTSACFGDSGSGLIATDDIGDVLVGVISFTYINCNSGNGYTRISKLYHWITHHVCEWAPCYCASQGMIPNEDGSNIVLDSCHEPTPSPSTNPKSDICIDSPGWLDFYGFSCDWYNTAPLGCALFDECCENTGFTAATACCKCGGGMSISSDIPDSMIPSNGLMTNYDGSPNDNGLMFDITALKEIRIFSFDIHVVQESKFKMNIYTKEGTFRGYESDKVSWIRHVHLLSLTGNGLNKSTPIPLNNNFLPIYVPQGNTQAFYVSVLNNLLVSSEGSITGSIISSNGDIEILEGLSIDNYFTPTSFVRKWNGAIYYSSAESVSPSITHSTAPTLKPSISYAPSNSPSFKPTYTPSVQPFSYPTMHPSTYPTPYLSNDPTLSPSYQPSADPTFTTSQVPSNAPTYSFAPIERESSYSSSPIFFFFASTLPSTRPTLVITGSPSVNVSGIQIISSDSSEPDELPIRTKSQENSSSYLSPHNMIVFPSVITLFLTLC